MTVQVNKVLKSLLDHIVTEFSEGDVGLCVVSFQKLLEFFMRVPDIQFPLVDENVLPFGEFSLTDTSLTVCVNLLKVLPQFVVETEIDQGPLEATPTDQAVGQFALALNLSQRRSVGPHDDRLGIKQFGKSEDISDSLVDFCQREPVVAIDIEFSEDFLSNGDGLRTGISRNLLCFLLCACSHERYNAKWFYQFYLSIKQMQLIWHNRCKNYICLEL